MFKYTIFSLLLVACMVKADRTPYFPSISYTNQCDHRWRFLCRHIVIGPYTLKSVNDNYKHCKEVYFNYRFHSIEIIKEGRNEIKQMILNTNDRTLYFIYDVTPGDGYYDFFDEMLRKPSTGLGYLNINTNEAGILEGIRDPTSIVIDQSHDVVYVGGPDGLYRMNNSLKVLERLPIEDNIHSLYFKDVLFYTNSRKEANKYEGGHSDAVYELEGVYVEKMVLDDDGNIVFTQGQGKTISTVKLGTREVHSVGSHGTNTLTTDLNHRPYIFKNDGVYMFNSNTYVFDKICDISGVKALTFYNGGEPIFAGAELIVRLKDNLQVQCIDL